MLRRWIRLTSEDDAALTAARTSRCQWRQVYPLDGTALECVIHHCAHPHDDPGGHPAPAPALQLELEPRPDWTVPFSNSITYTCQPGTHVERSEPDPTQVSSIVAGEIHCFYRCSC